MSIAWLQLYSCVIRLASINNNQTIFNICNTVEWSNVCFDWLIDWVFFSEAILYKPHTLLRRANYESTLEEMVFVLNLLLVFLFGFSSSSLALLLKALLRPQYSRVKEQPLCSFIMMFSVQLFGCVCMVFLFLLLL